MRLGVDYSGGRPGGAAIKAAGYDFALRYLNYAGSGRVDLNQEEITDLHSNGVDIVPIFESTANRLLDGYEAGLYDAKLSLTQLNLFKWPTNRPVYFAADFEATTNAQLSAIDSYLSGAASLMGLERVGIYGSNKVVSHCAQVGSASWFWQCLAWSYGELFPGRHIYQSKAGLTINGVGIDEDQSNSDDFGQWGPNTTSEEDEVATQADFDSLKDQVRRLSWAVFSGTEEESNSDAQRSADVEYRIQQIVDKTGAPDGTKINSVASRAQAAINMWINESHAAGKSDQEILDMINKAINGTHLVAPGTEPPAVFGQTELK